MAQCFWCRKNPVNNQAHYCQSENSERHKLCSTCHITGHACQTSCPLCWHFLAERFLEKENLCSGCVEPSIEPFEKLDSNNHALCKFCNECILCSFREQNDVTFFELCYRQQEARVQRILYLMQTCVQRIEADYDICSICMEILNGENPVKVLDECKHRFHVNCIEKWFEHKSCCPCCRRVYRIFNQPKSKRMRTRSPYTTMHINGS